MNPIAVFVAGKPLVAAAILSSAGFPHEVRMHIGLSGFDHVHLSGDNAMHPMAVSRLDIRLVVRPRASFATARRVACTKGGTAQEQVWPISSCS